jgi:preprotein translocase subunit SecG
MSIVLTLVVVAQVLSAIGVIVLVLLQHGKGADMGAAFGSGASGSLFGATGSANFLSRLTGVLAAVFFLSTLGLAFLQSKSTTEPRSVMEQPAAAPAQPGGAAPVPPADADATQKNGQSTQIPK